MNKIPMRDGRIDESKMIEFCSIGSRLTPLPDPAHGFENDSPGPSQPFENDLPEAGTVSVELLNGKKIALEPATAKCVELIQLHYAVLPLTMPHPARWDKAFENARRAEPETFAPNRRGAP
jgi:hypothetical protein